MSQHIRNTIATLFLLAVSIPCFAQVPALLPYKADVPPTEALPIDGLWKVNTIGKRIRIEQGRAYAVDSWLHALILRVQPDMVVITNLIQTGPNSFAGDDLPLSGRATYTLQDNGEISAVVAGIFGPIRYKLLPVAEDTSGDYVYEPPTSDAATFEDEPPGSYATISEPVRQAPVRPLPPPSRPISQADVPPFVSYEAYTGCDAGEGPVPAAASPRERMEDAVRVDRITQRTFASFDLDVVEAGIDNEAMAGLCWYRLDGVWREMGEITLDRTKDQPDTWGSDVPELIALANGNYTTPQYLYIGSVGNDDEELWLSEGFSQAGFVRYLSSDGLSIKETLTRGGPVKTYRAAGAAPYGRELRVDVTRSGRVRLSLDQTAFLRPKPGVSAATMSGQLAANDAFLLSYNLENLSASRKGYDARRYFGCQIRREIRYQGGA